MRFLIVDDHKLFSETLLMALKDRFSEAFIAEAGSFLEAKESLERDEFDIVLLDLNLGSTTSGLDLMPTIARLRTRPKVVIISMHKEAKIIHSAFDSGVQGYILKDTRLAQLVQAIQVVSQGGTWFSQEIMQIIRAPMNPTQGESDYSRYQSLTPQEQTIFSLRAEGLTAPEIGGRLNISERTVRNHLTKVHQKLDIEDHYSLIRFARQVGLVF